VFSTSQTAPNGAVRIGGLWFARRRPLDGPLGSELLARGFAAGRPGEGPAAPRAAAVRDLHAAYVRAGAQWVAADTFLMPGGARGAATAAGLCRNALRSARTAAPGLPVVLSLGPGGSAAGYRDLIRAAAAAADAGADLVLLETFVHLVEALEAVRAAVGVAAARRRLPPVVVLVVPDAAGRMLGSGEPVANAARTLVDAGAAGVGLNCQPPEILRPAVAEMAAAALPPGVPLIVRPSAGIPARVGETWRYPWAPEPWADAVAALQTCGADLLGGCCGAGPAHVASLARALGSEHS
jgi:methionine synthase I (cobalamin-dependent)